MIDKEQLAEAARNMDALASEHSLEYVCEKQDVDPEALYWAANQRALRIAMIMDGQDPAKITQKQDVHLSEQAELLLPSLIQLSMDGIIIGLAARQYSGFYGAGGKRG